MSLDWLFLALCVILLLYVSEFTGFIAMAAADLQKLVDNMKRANTITARAATDASKHSTIMDNFEKRLNLNHENMAKIEEYEKLMAQMDQSNGGPALIEETFRPEPAAPEIVGGSLPQRSPLFDETGKQIN